MTIEKPSGIVHAFSYVQLQFWVINISSYYLDVYVEGTVFSDTGLFEVVKYAQGQSNVCVSLHSLKAFSKSLCEEYRL